MLEVTYRNATIDDLDFLTESRLDFIELSRDDPNYEFIKGNTRNFFINGFKNGQCDVILAECDSVVIGTGIVFYYDSVPSLFNPRGKNAYITSMFVDEKYRRQGIAAAILDRLVNTAGAKGHNIFLLQASDTGRALYEKYGFCDGKKPMLLKYDNQ